jgi:hypothetical protein
MYDVRLTKQAKKDAEKVTRAGLIKKAPKVRVIPGLSELLLAGIRM